MFPQYIRRSKSIITHRNTMNHRDPPVACNDKFLHPFIQWLNCWFWFFTTYSILLRTCTYSIFWSNPQHIFIIRIKRITESQRSFTYFCLKNTIIPVNFHLHFFQTHIFQIGMRPTVTGYFMPFTGHFLHLYPSHTWLTLLFRHIPYPFSPYPESTLETYFFHFRENKRIVFF